MVVIVEVFEGTESRRSAQVEAMEAELVTAVLQRVAAELGIEHDELILDVSVGEVSIDPTWTVGEATRHGHHWHHRRTCVDLHFESEVQKHHFPVRAKWARVHQWGCKVFNVPNHLCANLQLRAESPKGPAINENLPIGHTHGCKVVWLVKPGPEPNGH